MPSDMVRAINALIKSGKQEGDTLNHPGFNTIDIYHIFKHAFNVNAVAALENKTDQLLHQYNRKLWEGPLFVVLGNLGLKSCITYKDQDTSDMYVRDFDLVHFIALQAPKDKLPQAIERVIATVNHVANLGFTRAALVKLSLVEIWVPDRPEQYFSVISYITLTKKGSEYVKANMADMFVEEGGMPMRIE